LDLRKVKSVARYGRNVEVPGQWDWGLGEPVMQEAFGTTAGRTTTDLVFDQLHEEIVSLQLLPNSKISEAEVANRMGVSRQPVRDAFNRLGNLDLLVIRPQRPTVVRGFSLEKIENARFVRLAVELEVIKKACAVWDAGKAAQLDANLDQQRATIKANRVEEFHALDYHFHRLICALSGHQLAFETVERCKQQIDRLCVLSLEQADEASAVLADHESIATALKTGSVETTVNLARRHLGRLDQTIREIHKAHSEYFE
jgi:DNA-binding GntR family transcriptional regulator